MAPGRVILIDIQNIVGRQRSEPGRKPRILRIRERIGLAQLRSRRVLLELPQALPLKRREVIRCLLDVIDALNQQGAVLGLLPLLVAPRDLCVHAMIR